ncbi:retropepsin-like aspartic protease [Sphaerothrix gracilis]|uniref:retropepsin-like aspartic protease family protein n=1 Tax=Sphaerothrix gracilis TaxID=3151835 RepID=UPI0031FCC029
MHFYAQTALSAVLLAGGIATGLTGCGDPRVAAESDVSVPEPAPATEVITASVETAEPPVAEPEATDSQPQRDYFREGVNAATSAVSIGQTAQSTEDWKLAAARWQKAIAYLQKVPTESANHATAQQKIQEYQKHLTNAQASAAGKTTSPSARIAASVAADGRKATIPIAGRQSGIPVVSVTMQGQNGKHTFPMLFDTGASGTLITPAMADALGVVIVGEARVTIADGSVVSLPIGYIDFVEAGGLRKESVTVAIGGTVGLLGQDFYGSYGLSVGQNSIVLY